jgi:hypothetical protein
MMAARIATMKVGQNRGAAEQKGVSHSSWATLI